MRPFLYMSAFYMVMAILMAADAALVSFNIIPGHAGLGWLRIHLITIGTVTQALYGLLPALAASRVGRPQPATRWDVWLTLNAGLVLLMIGLPLVNPVLIVAGGALVFGSAGLLIAHLSEFRMENAALRTELGGRRFYIAGLAYLLVGVTIGTGLFLNWSSALRIAVPIEVHIHANNWGFMALVLAGMLVDLYPRLTGRRLASPAAVTAIFWMMTVGALGLVVGPWVESGYSMLFAVPGLLLHLGATLWLLASVIKPIWGRRKDWEPGVWHLTTSYFWFLAPVLIAPLIIFKAPGFPGAGIEANAPQALVYGWVLHVGYAVIPWMLSRTFFPEREATLGGNWFSLFTVHAGGILLWASIFIRAYQDPLRGLAYSFWVVSLVPVAVEVWRVLKTGMESWDERAPSQNSSSSSRGAPPPSSGGAVHF